MKIPNKKYVYAALAVLALLVVLILAIPSGKSGSRSTRSIRGINAVLTPSFDDTEKYLRQHSQPADPLITMGCGNINLLNEQIQAHGDTAR